MSKFLNKKKQKKERKKKEKNFPIQKSKSMGKDVFRGKVM